MKMSKEDVVKLLAQIEKVTFKKNGEGQVVFNFGNDALYEIQKLQRYQQMFGGQINFELFVVPEKPENY